MGHDVPEIAPPSFARVPYEVGRAPHIGHRYHLCDMAERGDVSMEQMKDLVREPKFICSRCGRAAAERDNLCFPEDL